MNAIDEATKRQVLRSFFSPEFAAQRRAHYMAVPHVYGSGDEARVKAAFIDEPPSQWIAEWLDRRGASVCPHERNPCILRCGVRRIRGQWTVIPAMEREGWLGRMEKRQKGLET